jgi:hypothetical protein
MSSRLRDLLSVTLVLLAASPFTASFATFDLGDHPSGLIPHSAEILAAKLAVGEGLAVVGAPPEAEATSPLFVRVIARAVADEISKHQIPSSILRL